MTKLQVAICTLGNEGLQKVGKLFLPKVDGVSYLVSCQNVPVNLPPSLYRNDVQVVFSPTKGLSNNRNNALIHLTAPYALIADDDLEFYPDGLRTIIEKFDANPEIDIATFRAEVGNNKFYPDFEADIWCPPKGYWISSIEIALRLESIRKFELSFNPFWGLGSERLHCGEENIFLLMAQKAGLKGRFFPITIVRHPEVSTGVRLQQSPGVLRAYGAYIVYAYPFTSIFRLPLKAWRTTGRFIVNCRYIFSGALYAIRYRRKLLR